MAFPLNPFYAVEKAIRVPATPTFGGGGGLRNVIPVKDIESIASTNKNLQSNKESADQPFFINNAAVEKIQANVNVEENNWNILDKMKGNGSVNPSQIAGSGRSVDVVRLPFVLTCQEWIEKNSNNTSTTKDDTNAQSAPVRPEEIAARYIFCNVNPSQVTWNFPIRAENQKTLGGEVQHIWRSPERRNSYFDEPELSFTFQAGNILPVKMVKTFAQPNGKIELVEDTSQPEVPAGLNNLYKFIDLLNRPRTLVDANGNRKANVMYIIYNSRIFPRMTLQGMWSPEGFSFTDDASNPNTVTWTARFTVYSSFPQFTDPNQLISSFIAAGFGKQGGANTSATKKTGSQGSSSNNSAFGGSGNRQNPSR